MHVTPMAPGPPEAMLMHAVHVILRCYLASRRYSLGRRGYMQGG